MIRPPPATLRIVAPLAPRSTLIQRCCTARARPSATAPRPVASHEARWSFDSDGTSPALDGARVPGVRLRRRGLIFFRLLIAALRRAGRADRAAGARCA